MKAIESHELSPNIILESTSEGAAHRAKPSSCQRNSKVLDHPGIIVAWSWHF
jgi:hypothetical protein